MEHKKVRASGRVRWISGERGFAFARLAEGLQSPTLRLAALLLLQFSAAMLLAQGLFLERFAPFGLAFVAAAAAYSHFAPNCRRTMPLAALCGAMLGYLVAGGLTDGLKYCAAATLAYAVGLIFRGTAGIRRSWFAPLAAGGALAAVDLVFVMTAEPAPRDLLLLLCEVLLTAAAAYAYRPLFSLLPAGEREIARHPPDRTGSRSLALSAAGLSIVLVLGSLEPLFGLSIGRMAALFLTLCAASWNSSMGCAVGLLTGLSLDLTVSGVPSLTFAYAAAGLFAGAFRKNGSIWVILAFTAAHTALIPWAWREAPLTVLYECFAVSGIWFLARRPLSALIRRVMQAASGILPVVGSIADKQNPAGRLQALTAAFGTVRDAVRIRDAPQQDLPLSAYDIAVERVCRNCRVNEQCWNQEYEKTRTALNTASEEIRRRGRAHAEDFPPHFAARCENLAEFVANVNENLALRESRSRYRRRAADDTRLLRAQYDAMAQVLEEVSAAIACHAEVMEEETHALRRALSGRGIALQAGLYRTRRGVECRIHAASGMPRMLLEELEDLAGEVSGRNLRLADTAGEPLVLQETEMLRAVVGVGLRQRRGEEESGDSAAYFRTEEGKLYLILADGMGTGGHAARESAAFVRMLEGFLRAGVSVHGALRLLSPAFAVKNGGDSFTTCDILEVDLFTGESACYKCGAAPTYLCARDERGVQRISSGSMPVGLPEEMPETDRTKLRLEVGDLLVMISDGLSEPEGDGWLTDLLTAHRFTSATALASEILEAGEARGCDRDDMTVLVLKLSAMRS